MKNFFIFLICILVGFCFVKIVVSNANATPFDLGLAQPFTILQLGGGPGVDGTLDISSKSTVFGDVGKKKDNEGKEFKISSSTIQGNTNRESGVPLDISSSTITGDNKILSSFDLIVQNAIDAAMFAEGLPGVSETIILESGASRKFIGGGGANVINVFGDFIIDDSTLELEGGVSDFFIFNILPSSEFEVKSDAEIKLSGDIDASDVLFNVMGSVGGGGKDDVHIQESIFRGTLLAQGRNALIDDNEFSENHGLYGAIVAGGKIIFQESDIIHEPFMPHAVPEPATIFLIGFGLFGVAGFKMKVKKS